MSETKLRACPLDARILEDAATELVVADVRTHIGEEDARRLAACWNACAGIPTECLEGIVSVTTKFETEIIEREDGTEVRRALGGPTYTITVRRLP